MAREKLSPAMEWLIVELEFPGHPSKIERLQRDGLAPRPLIHRHETLTGADLWPDGAVEHYRAVLPLIRQRHDAKELAALTMLGWGYPIEIGLLRRSYPKAYAVGDVESRVDSLVDRYANRGMPIFKIAMAHVRSHGLASGQTSEDLADDMLTAMLRFATGRARTDQVRLMLAASLPKFGEAPEELLNWVLELFVVLQREISLPRLLDTVNDSSTDDLLRAQKEVVPDLETDFAYFGGLDVACRGCAETKGLMAAAVIPMYLRLENLDADQILKELPPPPV